MHLQYPLLRSAVVCLAVFGLWGATNASIAETLEKSTATSQVQSEDERLTDLLDRAFDERLALAPESLTSLGSKKFYDRLNDYRDDAQRIGLDLAEKQLSEIKSTIDYKKLSKSGRLSYRLFEHEVTQSRSGFQWRYHRYPVTSTISPAGSIPVFLVNEHRVENLSDARAYIARLREVERVMHEISASLETRASKGITAPSFTFKPVMQDAGRVLSGAPFDTGPDNTLFADFKTKIDAIDVSADIKQDLLADVQDALKGPFKRGYEHLLATLSKLEKQTTTNNGVWSLPDGDAYYAYALKVATTTDLSPKEVHEIGLAEVERIHREMESIKDQVGFKGTLTDFFGFIKQSPDFQYPNTEEGRQAYLADAKQAIDNVMERAPSMFHNLPKAQLEVRAVEQWRQDTAPLAFYNWPAPDGSRPGIYYINLKDMRQILKPQVEVIAYHEGAPGHHFQIALAQQLENLPKFRRFGRYGAFQEGWALYSEQLAKELGFYKDPYSEFGRLSLELLRAIRLVIDTGVHAKRWTREQSITYMQQNTLLSDQDITKEVERYIVWPGQASSYKVGQLEILKLRSKAKSTLGPKFDIRDFHQIMLNNGALPLDILGELVDEYIEEGAGQ